jgi:hypothetical protein
MTPAPEESGGRLRFGAGNGYEFTMWQPSLLWLDFNVNIILCPERQGEVVAIQRPTGWKMQSPSSTSSTNRSPQGNASYMPWL